MRPATVQTLSRLNRIYPGKTTPMIVGFRNTPASVQKDIAFYYSDAHVEDDVDPNALQTLGERMAPAGLDGQDDMDAVADAFLADAGGETIAKALAPIKVNLGHPVEASKADEGQDPQGGAGAVPRRRARLPQRMAFLSQIVDYQDPDLHRRAILATLLVRNLHVDGTEGDDSYLGGVQLSGVKLVPSAINEDHSLIQGGTEAIKLPEFDDERRGSTGTPERGPVDEDTDRANEMFEAKGVDVSPESVSGFITTFWGFLDANEEAVAMARNNTVAQLKASEPGGLEDLPGVPRHPVQHDRPSVHRRHREHLGGRAALPAPSRPGVRGRAGGTGIMSAEPARPLFGEVIREARKKRGWSQEELGQAASLSRPTIARVEADSDVSTATIGKIAQALGLTLELTDRG